MNELQTIKLQLLVNDKPFCGIRSTGVYLDIRYLFDEFKKQIDNILENGYCGEEKIADIINEGRFTGWNEFNTKTKTRTRTKL